VPRLSEFYGIAIYVYFAGHDVGHPARHLRWRQLGAHDPLDRSRRPLGPRTADATRLRPVLGRDTDRDRAVWPDRGGRHCEHVVDNGPGRADPHLGFVQWAAVSSIILARWQPVPRQATELTETAPIRG